MGGCPFTRELPVFFPSFRTYTNSAANGTPRGISSGKGANIRFYRPDVSGNGYAIRSFESSNRVYIHRECIEPSPVSVFWIARIHPGREIRNVEGHAFEALRQLAGGSRVILRTGVGHGWRASAGNASLNTHECGVWSRLRRSWVSLHGRSLHRLRAAVQRGERVLRWLWWERLR
jgi:hypothetical protein